MVFWLKLASHPATHNFTMYVRNIWSSPGKTWNSLASSDNVYKDSQNPFIYCSICPFGCFALIGDVGRSDILCGASYSKYCPDASVSDMDDLLVRDGYGGSNE